jgi:hypothetical protein
MKKGLLGAVIAAAAMLAGCGGNNEDTRSTMSPELAAKVAKADAVTQAAWDARGWTNGHRRTELLHSYIQQGTFTIYHGRMKKPFDLLDRAQIVVTQVYDEFQMTYLFYVNGILYQEAWVCPASACGVTTFTLWRSDGGWGYVKIDGNTVTWHHDDMNGTTHAGEVLVDDDVMNHLLDMLNGDYNPMPPDGLAGPLSFSPNYTSDVALAGTIQTQGENFDGTPDGDHYYASTNVNHYSTPASGAGN